MNHSGWKDDIKKCGEYGEYESKYIARDLEHYKEIYNSRRLCATREKVYGNNVMLGPDNSFLCRCANKKIEWYLSRSLAEIVQDKNPRIIRLLFVPGGPGHKGDSYYEQTFLDRCVVCGFEKELTSHHIVPFCYRRTLSEEKKEHNYHDILILCIKCHNIYERLADKLKIELANEYDAPLEGMGYVGSQVDNRRFQSAVHALFRFQEQIPPARIDELRKMIVKGASEIDEPTRRLYLRFPRLRYLFFDRLFTREQLGEAARPIYAKADDFKTHGHLVTDQLDDDGLHEFVKRWRKHFLDGMKPQFMPDHWDMNRPMWNTY